MYPCVEGQRLVAEEELQQRRRHHDLLPAPAAQLRDLRIDVVQEVVRVPDDDAQHVHLHGVADEHRERQQHPRQVGRAERQHAEEAHVHMEVVRVPRPQVDHHEGQRVAQELDPLEHVDRRRGHQHQRCAVDQHENEVRCSPSKGPFLQQSAVAHDEVHVKQEVQVEGPEEQEGRQQPPILPLVHDQLIIVVQR